MILFRILLVVDVVHALILLLLLHLILFVLHTRQHTFVWLAIHTSRLAVDLCMCVLVTCVLVVLSWRLVVLAMLSVAGVVVVFVVFVPNAVVLDMVHVLILLLLLHLLLGHTTLTTTKDHTRIRPPTTHLTTNQQIMTLLDVLT